MKIAFSLETVNTRYQEPNRNRVESKYYWEELFSMVPAGGFDAIDCPYDSGFMGARCAYPFSKVVINVKFGGLDAYKQMLKTKGINTIAGLQFAPRAAGNLEQYIGGFANGVKGMLAYAKELGCEYVAVSATPELYTMGALLENKDELLDKTADMFNSLVAEAGDVKLCVRNDYWGLLRGDAMHDFMAKLDAKIGYCVDLAHVAVAGCDPVDFIKKCGKRIGCVYLTDTSFEDKYDCYKSNSPMFPQQCATQIFKDLGQGSVDLAGVFAALKTAGFDGWAIADNRQTRDVPRGILRARYALHDIKEA